MSNSKPKRSMAEADAKELKMALVVFSGIFFIVYLLFLFNIGGNFFHYYYVKANLFWNVVAPVSAAGHYYILWNKFKDADSEAGAKITKQAILLFGWFALNIFLFAGWKFPLP